MGKRGDRHIQPRKPFFFLRFQHCTLLLSHLNPIISFAIVPLDTPETSLLQTPRQLYILYVDTIRLLSTGTYTPASPPYSTCPEYKAYVVAVAYLLCSCCEHYILSHQPQRQPPDGPRPSGVSLSLRSGYLHSRLDVVFVASFIFLTSATEIISCCWHSSHSTDSQRPGRERRCSTRARRRVFSLSHSRHVNSHPQRQQTIFAEAVANKHEQAHPIPRCRSHGRRLPTRTADGPALGSRQIMSKRAGGQVLPLDCAGRMRTLTA